MDVVKDRGVHPRANETKPGRVYQYNNTYYLRFNIPGTSPKDEIPFVDIVTGQYVGWPPDDRLIPVSAELHVPDGVWEKTRLGD